MENIESEQHKVLRWYRWIILGPQTVLQSTNNEFHEEKAHSNKVGPYWMHNSTYGEITPVPHVFSAIYRVPNVTPFANDRRDPS